jgi:hypothetical protein
LSAADRPYCPRPGFGRPETKPVQKPHCLQSAGF